jgi:hypothetical protein
LSSPPSSAVSSPVPPKIVTGLPTEQLPQVYSFFDLADYVGFARLISDASSSTRGHLQSCCVEIPRASSCTSRHVARPTRRGPSTRTGSRAASRNSTDAWSENFRHDKECFDFLKSCRTTSGP